MMLFKPKSNGILALLLRLIAHLSVRRRRQLFFLLLLMFFSAVTEVITLGAVLPFIGALTVPERLFERPVVKAFATLLDIRSPEQLVLPLTIAFVLAAVVAATIRVAVLWVNTSVAFAGGTELSIQAYRRTLYQPYQTHTARNSSVVISGIVDKVNGATAVLLVLLNFASSIIFLVTVMITLVVIQPVIAMVSFLGFGLNYALILWPAKRILKRNSNRIAIEQTRVIQALQEGLGAIRDVILDGTQELYCNVYRTADYRLRGANAKTTFIGQSPRFATEAIGTIVIALVAYGLAASGGLTAALPMLALLALGAQRLLPALQQAYASWGGIAGSEGILVGALELLDQKIPDDDTQATTVALPFVSFIGLEDVSFQYDQNGLSVVDHIDLKVGKGMRVGLVGSSGSGKSTLMDLMMGLLRPTEGRLLIDGKPLDVQNLKAWQRTIAHVPQSIFIADTSFAENIAFGVERSGIDLDRVRDAAEQAQLSDLIESRRKGYFTTIGERGAQLSGGQRQRVGLARALYKQASVLFLDEPTAALDSVTERSILQSLDKLSRELTIIIIAHRISTVQSCDMIVQLEKGRIVATGTYQDLIAKSESFRKLAVV